MPNDYMQPSEPPVDMRGYLKQLVDSLMPWKGPRTKDIELANESGNQDPRLQRSTVEQMLDAAATPYTGLASAFRRFK